jgi:ABC-type transporter Mla subunit MlaD
MLRVEVKSSRLETIVEQIGEAVLATTETIERLSDRVDALTNQVQQQGYQIFALSDAIQTLAENQESSLAQITQLTEVLKRMVNRMEASNKPPLPGNNQGRHIS